jgi:hypothetical protein
MGDGEWVVTFEVKLIYDVVVDKQGGWVGEK